MEIRLSPPAHLSRTVPLGEEARTDPYGLNEYFYEELIAQWVAMPKDGLSDPQRRWARNVLLTCAPAWIDDRLSAPRRELRARPPYEDWSDWLGAA